jgi:seryl-tRNA(Sec) selenium transferase
MADWFLIAWFMAGATAAYGFALLAWVHARRNGRRWHEVAMATQSLGLVMACAWVLATLVVGPLWAVPVAVVGTWAGIATGSILFEYLAKRSVAAREAGR